MYRRSNSSSNIPLLKTNLFGSKESKTSKVPIRSQSTSRLSQRDSVTSVSQLRPQRKSSLDRKSSTVGLARTTPLLKPGTRSGSLQRTTPTSALSQRTNSSRGTTPLSCRKDYVTIQKLSTDKAWVAEQYIKVQNFIMSSNLFDLSVVNSTNIRPPSINNFMYITGVLLMEIFPRVKISKENYKEVIPAQLKVLRYPGTLTNSILKTVNTMHSWPQVVGMWSWLIDKVKITRVSDDVSFINHLEPEERKNYLLRQNCTDFLVKRYKIFNKNDSDYEEEIEKVNDAYVKNLAELLEVDFEQFEQLQDDVAKKKEYRDKQVMEIEHIKEEKKRMETEIEEMKAEIKEFQESYPIEERNLDNKLEVLQSKLKHQQESIRSTKENISQLQEAIKVQPCTYQEKLALLRQIDELKREVEVKREKIEHAREIKNKFDHILAAEISKIQSLVIQWNRSLMEVSIKKPHLKKLLFREKGFHDAKFLEELQEVMDYKGVVENEVADSLAKIEEDLRAEQWKKCEAEKEAQEVAEIISRNNEEYLVIAERITGVKMEMNKISRDLEERKVTHSQQIKKLQENDVLEVQAKTITELKMEKDRLEEEIKKLAPKMLSFFVEMHNQIVKNLKALDGVTSDMAKAIEDKQKYIVLKQRQMIEVLQSLKEE